jgi:integrase/recombinase XerC
MKNADALAVFQKNLKILGYSAHTLRSYRSNLEDFCTFLEQVGVEEIEEVDLEILRAYIARLVSTKIKKVTICLKISVFKAFFTFLFQNQYIDKNPAVRIRYPKTEKTLPHVLLSEQIEKILDFAMCTAQNKKLNDLEHYPQALQNYALLELLYSSGLRISEAWSLTVEDLDFAENQLSVVGKGNKGRVVPFNLAARKVLLELVELRHNSGTLFLSAKGVRLGVRDAYRIVTEVSNSAGVEGVYPHLLRHTMATHMIDNDADIRIVQEILGHSSLITTQKYVHVSKKKLQAIYLQAFPRA